MAEQQTLDTAPVDVELDGVKYALVRQTTGGDYLHVRGEAAVFDSDGKPSVDNGKYEHANLVVRLRLDGKRLGDAEVRDIPRPHYQTLSTLAAHLDNEESGVTNDFLSTHLRRFPAFASALETLSASRQDGQEGSSDSEKPSGKRPRSKS